MFRYLVNTKYLNIMICTMSVSSFPRFDKNGLVWDSLHATICYFFYIIGILVSELKRGIVKILHISPYFGDGMMFYLYQAIHSSLLYIYNLKAASLH